MASILVTGGAGYVGSHCAKALADRDFVRWGPLIEGDIRNAAALDALFGAYRIDAVMHFAALAYVGEPVTAPVGSPTSSASA